MEAAETAAVRPAESPVRLTLLNGFELYCSGQAVALPMAAQRLIAFVGLHPKPLHRTFVAGRLWFTGPDCNAYMCLRSALWRVRQACDAGVVEANRTHLRLAPEIPVDARLQATVARRVLDPCTTPDAADTRVLEGELLPDWYDDWVVFERERLRQIRLHALETLALRLADDARFGEAVEAAFAALRGDELRESAHRTLIRIYLAEGNRLEAMRDLQHYRQLLQRRVGLAPSPELEMLLTT